MFKALKQTTSVGIFSCQKRFATKQSAGGARYGKDSHSKRLGVKKSGGSVVKSGQIIIRQKGNTWWPGYNVGQGRDFTIYALNPGKVEFFKDERYQRTYISVIPDKTKLQERNGLPIRWIDENRFMVPKTIRFQTRYVLDQATVGRKCQKLKSLRRKPSLSVLNAFRKKKALKAASLLLERQVAKIATL